MIGERSIFTTISVNNFKNSAAPFKVVVQANKNGGICDVILPKTQAEPASVMVITAVPAEPVKPVDTSNGEAVRAYNAAKKEYDCYMRERSALRSEVLNHYQGRQLYSAYVEETLDNFLTYLLNQ